MSAIAIFQQSRAAYRGEFFCFPAQIGGPHRVLGNLS